MTLGRHNLSRVRCFGDAATDALELYVLGGMFAPAEVPRGIDRAGVAEFLSSRVTEDSPPSTFRHTLETMRFYELETVAPSIVRRLKNPLENLTELERAAYVVQIAADFGADDMPQRANQYLDETVIGHPLAASLLSLFIDTKVVLAPVGSLDSIRRRLSLELEGASGRMTDEASFAAYHRLQHLAANKLPLAEFAIRRMAEIDALGTEDRVPALLAVYLDQSDLAGSYAGCWAARALRQYALDDAKPAVAQTLDALSTLFSAYADAKAVPAGQRFTVERAAEAHAYLSGEWNLAARAVVNPESYQGIHFLSDR